MRLTRVIELVMLASLAASGCIDRPTLSASPTTATAPNSQATPTNAPAPSSAVAATAAPLPPMTACAEGKPRTLGGSKLFEGTCFGWRVGAEDYFGGDRYERNLQLACVPDLYGDSIETSGPPAIDHLTDLDIGFTTLPEGATIQHLDKWACGSTGVSDHLVVTLGTPQFGGTVDITRSLEGNPWLEVRASPSSVHACGVFGRPAICVDYGADDVDHQFTFAYVFVLEDATVDPHAVVLRLYSEDVPLDDLRRLAESVVGA